MSSKVEDVEHAVDMKDRDIIHGVGDDAIDNEGGTEDREVKVGRKLDFGFIPIPKSKRHDPNLKVHEQFAFTWRMNLILAGAAVSVSVLQSPWTEISVTRVWS